MKCNSFSMLIFLLFSAIIMFSCSNGTSGEHAQVNGEIRFSLGMSGMTKNYVTRGSGVPQYIIVSITNTDADTAFYNREKIELFNFNGEYLSNGIALAAGDYQLTEFLVVDETNTIIYIAPVTGSVNAEQVTAPLPINFTITSNETNTLCPQVVQVEENLLNYGYVAFTFDVQDGTGDTDNLLINGDFSDDTTGWNLWPEANTDNVMVTESGELKITIADPGENTWDRGIGQQGFTLEYGETYILTFDARSETIESITNIVQMYGGDWKVYSQSRELLLSPEMTSYIITFTMNLPTDTNADCEFFLGGKGPGIIYLDNIELKKLISPPAGANLVSNGSFTDGDTGWTLWTDDTTQAAGALEDVSGNTMYRVDITGTGSQSWQLGLSHRGLILERGEGYRVTFKARADAPRTINFLLQLGRSPWTLYSYDISVDLTAELKEFEQTFFMSNPTDADSELVLFLGALQTGNIYIDDVVVEKISNQVEEIDYPKVTPNVDYSNLILYEISPDSYNGVWSDGNSLTYITSQLDRIKDMGINCIWINPVFLGEGMGYWTYDYYQISYKLGTLNDMKELVYEAHKRDMLVIIDLVINHIWMEHPFFQDVLANGSDSPYADYFIWDGEPGSSNAQVLPWDPTLVNINFDSSLAKEYMFTVAEYWINKLDIDGYRVDVAMELENRHPGVSAELIDRLEAIKPGVFMLAEGYVNEERFFEAGYDSAYDWDLHSWETVTTHGNAFRKAFEGTITLQEMHNILTRSIAGSGLPLRFAENHDLSRAASLWGVGGSRVAHTVVMTSRGYAMVYGGGEVGFAPPAEIQWSQSDPIVWDTTCPLYEYFPKIVNIRRNYLKSDMNQYWISNDNTGIYSSLSVAGNNKIITVANFTEQQQTVTLDVTLTELGTMTQYTDLIDNSVYVYDDSGSITITLEGYGTALFAVQ